MKTLMKFNDVFNERVAYAMHPDLIERSIFKSDSAGSLSQTQLDKIFYNKISNENVKYLYRLGKSGHKDDYISYEYNSFGYRGKEFEVNEDLVIAGCSQTFGMGLEENQVWGNILAKHFELRASNLSIPGSSTESIVNNIFAYFKEYGHPKMLLALFPDMYRMQIPTHRNQITSSAIRNENDKEGGHPYLTYLYLDKVDQKTKPNYQKSPFDLEEILTPDVAFFHNMKSIMILSQYCKAVGIKFYWSTWREELDIAITKIKTESREYDDYVSLDFCNWYTSYEDGKDPFGIEGTLIYLSKYHNQYALDCNKCYNNQACSEIVECHEYLKESSPELFEYGIDRVHMGTHKQQHIAESFIKRIENE